MNPDAQRVIEFWFNRPPLEWFLAPEGIDDQIRLEFGNLVMKARNNELDDWSEEPESCLALIILLDQFSRNIFRNTPEAFSADGKVWDIATKAIARNFDKDEKMNIIQATAFYIVLMHKEALISVIAARSLFDNLKQWCTTNQEREWLEIGGTAVNKQISLLEQFRRYPKRNAALGRQNTIAEEEFLNKT